MSCPRRFAFRVKAPLLDFLLCVLCGSTAPFRMNADAARLGRLALPDRPSVRGFTVVELMIGAMLAGFVMIGILASFLMIGRTGANLQNYADIEAQARKALEIFSQEVRLAHDVTSAEPGSVTLSIPDTSANRDAFGYSVTYSFDSAAGVLSRIGPPIGNAAGVVSTSSLLTGVHQITAVSPFQYFRYVNPISYPPGHDYLDGFASNTATNVAEVKQIEVNFLVKRQSITVPTATNRVISARFILRNK